MQSNRIWKKETPLVISHRGASSYAPENTMSAFQLAFEMGTEAIELDAKLTHDDEIIILHDPMVDRTTNGVGTARKLRLEEIRLLDAGSHFNKQFAGEKIPLLKEVLETFGDKLLINIELTNYTSPTDRLPVFVKELLRDLRIESGILFSSFSPLNLLRTRILLPEFPFALLLDPKSPAIIRNLLRSILQYDFLHPHLSTVNFDLVNNLHRMGKGINVWTVNEEEHISAISSLGVDGIITDRPDIALNVIKQGNWKKTQSL